MPDTDQDICIAKMQKDIDEIKKDLANNPTKDEVKLAFKEGLEEFTKTCDQKYASKATEKIVYGFVGMILSAFAAGVIYLVLK